MACTTRAEEALKTAPDFTTFYSEMNARLSASDAVVTQDMEDFLGEMKTCLDRKKLGITSLATDISRRTSHLADLRRGDINMAKEQAEIAKQRVEYTREAGRHVSYYEGWLALGRPLQPYMILLLLTLSLLLTLGSLFFLANMFGYSVTVLTPPAGAASSPNPLVQYLAQFGAPFWLLLIGVIIGFIYYRSKAKEKAKEAVA